MGRIISKFKVFLFLGFVMTVGAVTNSMAQSDDNNGKDDWLRGPKVGCPGGYYLDYFPPGEQYIINAGYPVNGDGWVCIKIIGNNRNMYVTDNEFTWPPQ